MHYSLNGEVCVYIYMYICLKCEIFFLLWRKQTYIVYNSNTVSKISLTDKLTHISFVATENTQSLRQTQAWTEALKTFDPCHWCPLLFWHGVWLVHLIWCLTAWISLSSKTAVYWFAHHSTKRLANCHISVVWFCAITHALFMCRVTIILHVILELNRPDHHSFSS